MNIGFDLDKVFVNHPPFVPYWLIQKLYGEKVNGNLSYRIPGKAEQYIRKLSHIPFLRPPMQENIIILKNMAKNKNIRTFLISSRFGFLKKETDIVMQKYHLAELFSKIDFNFLNKQPHLFKGEKIREEKIDRFVDDDLPLLQFLAKKYPKVIFFWFNKTRNDKLKGNLFAITHLASVFENL